MEKYDNMSDLVDIILKKLSPKAVKSLSQLDLRSEAEKAKEGLDQLNNEILNIQVESHLKEIETRVQMEERHIRLYKSLNFTLTLELERMNLLKSQLELVGAQSDSKKKIEIYDKLLKNFDQESNIDICAVVDMHEEAQATKKKISELENKIAKFAGIPPDMRRAREAVRELTEEIKRLEVQAEQDLADEVQSMMMISNLQRGHHY